MGAERLESAMSGEEGGKMDFSARDEQKGWTDGPKREEGKGKPAQGGRERLWAEGGRE
uniref:Uncharacterized protein n=1 Tax=Oryza sativa subsp. japonica TaxID=39947 RepID=Q6Z5H9_ORYSJ|nr:hypothetical protein [Oryza sativa Japonica Group]